MKKDAPKLLFSCSQTTDALKKKAAAVNNLSIGGNSSIKNWLTIISQAKNNADAVKKAKEKSAKLAGSSRSQAFKNSSILKFHFFQARE